MRPTLFALGLLTAQPPVPLPVPVTPPVWFEAGHRLVARVALTRLTPHTLAAMRDLLGGQDPVEAALWADQIRGSRRETGPLHYVNIPLAAAGYDAATQCPKGQCIIAAIERDRAILADSTRSVPDRAEALRFLLHLIGDLHQPLHVSDNGDRGGNATEVSLFDRVTTLHKVWDGGLIEGSGMDEEQYFRHLRQRMAALDLAALERGSVVDWAMEGHRIAAADAYHLPKGMHLDAAYLEANLPRIDLAIIEAGVRLARVLNAALGGYRPAPASQALGPGIYTDHDATAHEGEDATVIGVVISVHRTRSGASYLNFGADYPQQTFSGVILDPRDPAFLALDSLPGRRIGIRGWIQRYQGRLEIVIRHADQIIDVP